MGKIGKSNRRGNGSHNPRIEKRIEKQQWPSRVISSEVPRTLIPNSSSANLASGDHYGGYIFMCNGKTKTDCFKYGVFGLPAARMDVLDNIHPQMKLFLFDFDLRLLYGIFVPASKGEMSIESTAFGGRFSAQVRFQIYKDCLPLPESVFKPIIRDNYQGSKFRQELSNEHVQNLISLFRPVDMSPSQAVVSPERNGEPPGFGIYSRPGDGVSASCSQDLAGLHVVQERPPRYSQHIEEPLLHVSHASVAKLHGMNIPPGRAQPHLQQYNSDEAHQGYFPALREEELYNRYAAIPRNNQVRLVNRNSIAQSHHNFPSQLSTPSQGKDHLSRKPLSAAYWISVANESLQKEMHPPSRQDTPVVAPRQIPPIEEREAPIISQHPPTENDDSLSAAVTAVVVQQVFEDVPMHLPTTSPSNPGYWTAVASQDPNQVYSGHSQWQQVASAGVNTENAPTSVVQTDFYSVPETGTNHYVPSTGATFDYYNYGIMSGANGVPFQHYDSTAHYSGTSGVPAQAYYPAQAGDLAAYYSGPTSVHPQAYDTTAAHCCANTVIPAQSHEVAVHYSVTTAIPGQAQDQGAYYFPENLYGYSHVPSSSSQAPAYWDPNQNQVGVTQVPAYWDPNHNQVGVTHFPQPIIPSGNNISSVGGEQLTAPFLEQQLP